MMKHSRDTCKSYTQIQDLTCPFLVKFGLARLIPVFVSSVTGKTGLCLLRWQTGAWIFLAAHRAKVNGRQTAQTEKGTFESVSAVPHSVWVFALITCQYPATFTWIIRQGKGLYYLHKLSSTIFFCCSKQPSTTFVSLLGCVVLLRCRGTLLRARGPVPRW